MQAGQSARQLACDGVVDRKTALRYFEAARTCGFGRETPLDGGGGGQSRPSAARGADVRGVQAAPLPDAPHIDGSTNVVTFRRSGSRRGMSLFTRALPLDPLARVSG
jgi:hypothetical protein